MEFVEGVTLADQIHDNVPIALWRKLEIVEERSAVLVDMLERHEIDMALAYEVHERPGMLRVPLVEEEISVDVAPSGER